MLLSRLPKAVTLLVVGVLSLFTALACRSAGEDFGRALSINTQADADAAAGTSELDFLFVSGDVTDLSPLLSLESVRAGIYIDGTSALRTLHGLENVRDPEQGATGALPVRLEDNSALEDVSALQMPRACSIEFIGGNTSLTSIELSVVELDFLVVENEQTATTVRSSTLEIVNQSLTVSDVPLLCTVELPALRVLGSITASYEVCWPEEDRQALREQAGDGS